MTLYAKGTNKRIIGTLERVYGVADVIGLDPTGSPIYGGETKIDWDSQEPVLRGGKSIWICEDGSQHTDVVEVPTFDNTQALTEGWGVFFTTGTDDCGDYRIERWDEADEFPDDSSAWIHVFREAFWGSLYHREALTFIRRTNSCEFTRMAEYIGKWVLEPLTIYDSKLSLNDACDHYNEENQ